MLQSQSHATTASVGVSNFGLFFEGAFEGAFFEGDWFGGRLARARTDDDDGFV